MGIATLAFTTGISAQWYAMTQELAFITACLLIPLLRKFTRIPEGRYGVPRACAG